MPKGKNENIVNYLQTLYTVTNKDVTTLTLRYLNTTAAATPDYTKRFLDLLAASVSS
jgi:hypothetical protein